VWTLIAARHGRIPPSRVADVDLGKTVVIRLDATMLGLFRGSAEGLLEVFARVSRRTDR
jgi:hypothetical protein